jgi:integrase
MNDAVSSDDPILTSGPAARLLQISSSTLYQWVLARRRPVTRFVSRVYTFGAEQRLVPADRESSDGRQEAGERERPRDRVLTDDEIRRLWEACATRNAYVYAWCGRIVPQKLTFRTD